MRTTLFISFVLPPAITLAQPVTTELQAPRAGLAAAAPKRDPFRHDARLARGEDRQALTHQSRAGSVTSGLDDSGVGVEVTLLLIDSGDGHDHSNG